MHTVQVSGMRIFHRRIAVILIIALSGTLGVWSFWIMAPALINSWELPVYDQRLKWAEKASPHPDIVLIGRDSESERQLGYGIWDRAVFATMIAALGKAGASVVALDFAFVGPSPPERGGHVSDERLAQAIKEMGHVVLPLPVQIGNISPAGQIGREQPHLDQFINTLGPSMKAGDLSLLEEASLLGAVLPDLFESTHRWGHIASVADEDGVFRRVPAFLHVAGHAVPAFGMAIATSYLNVSSEDISFEAGKHVTLRNEKRTAGKIADLTIPINTNNQLSIHFAGVWDMAPFPYLTFSDVLETITEDKLHELKHWVDGKIVLIFHAGAEHDKRRTPLELHAPGGFIHANVIHTILTRAFLQDTPKWTTLLILLILTVSTATCVVSFPLRSGWLGVLIIMGTYLSLSQLALSLSGRVYPLVLPFIGMAASTGLAYAWAIWEEKKKIQSLEGSLNTSQHELTRAREDLARTESLVEQLEEDLEASKAEALANDIQQQQGSQDIHALGEKLRIAETELRTSQSAATQLQTELEDSRMKALATEKDQQELQGLKELEGELEGKLQIAEFRLATAQTEVTKLQEDFDAHLEEMKKREKSHQLTLRNAREFKTKLHEAEANLQMSRQEIVQLKNSRTNPQPAAVRPNTLSDPELDTLRRECENQHHILTNDARLLSQFKDLKKVATTPMSIMILGEPGTGKELFAKALHQLSGRQGEFITTNMAAIPRHLFEAQWFGHVKGAFTDAKQDQKGLFDAAYGGTIFLDEIGDLQLDIQAKLLRAIEYKMITPVGSTRAKAIDVRVVTATNKDLLKGVEEGWFRRDLYDRLLGFTLHLPPLRERKHDLEFLSRRIIAKVGKEIKNENVQLSEDALGAIKSWSWPGNIRELEKVLALTVTLTDHNLIGVEDIRMDVQPQAQAQAQVQVQREALTPDQEAPQDVSGDLALLHCLRQNGFDMQATAQAVGWERSTVTQRLKGLCFQALVDNECHRTNAAKALAKNEQVATRLVGLKLNTYYDHLLKLVAESNNLEEAIITCRRRLKNLPDRHVPAMETLIGYAWKK